MKSEYAATDDSSENFYQGYFGYVKVKIRTVLQQKNTCNFVNTVQYSGGLFNIKFCISHYLVLKLYDLNV